MIAFLKIDYTRPFLLVVQQKDCTAATGNHENYSAKWWWCSGGMDVDQLPMASRCVFNYDKYDPFEMMMLISAIVPYYIL